MTRLHLRSNAPYALGAALLAALLYSMLWIGAAHADTGAIAPAASPALTDTGSNVLAIVALCISGILLVMRGLEMILAAIAPRTETKLDDALLADIRWGINVLKGIPGLPQPPQPAAPVTVNVAGPAAMLAVLLLGLGATALPACSHLDTVKADAGALAHGAVTCAKADIPAVKALGLQLTMEALVSAATGHGIPWAQLEADAEAGAKAQGIAVGSCAFGQLIADLAKLLPSPAPGVMARTDGDGNAELAAFKARLGVAEIRLGSGQVL